LLENPCSKRECKTNWNKYYFKINMFELSIKKKLKKKSKHKKKNRPSSQNPHQSLKKDTITPDWNIATQNTKRRILTSS
jgi:hypothetical protein